ncbi:Ig-like domain-containing protein [Pseudorhizobium marinum]|uniref:Ig-like domain-containing protein n=1 Tax=Pseudorhizobium marinum TaxID=1496690 RepID=UPI000496CEE6|nr:Ig-like domain-containing protein [Pseudorhizobium marinum]
MRNRAGWLAFVVLVAATLLMVFFVLPRISSDGERISDAVNQAGQTVKEAVTEETPPVNPPAKPSSSVATAPDTATADSTQPTAAPVTPAFDVLRVEPDGSTVIAGRAEPGATIEVNGGDAAIASTKVGPSGDFVIALDEPLPAGDYQLTLKATTPDGRTVTSDETATVSIPDNASGKLLAMVTKPGKASRLVSVPAADAATANTSASAQVPTPDGTDSAIAGDTGTPSLPAMPDAASDLVASAPPASTMPTPAEPSAPSAPSAELQVTAVEIESNRIFIAGTSPAGASLVGFAGEQPVGRSKAGPDGHFVIEGTVELAVGQHVIAVEMLDSNGKTALRVDVPFNRPAGEQVAAVAGQQGPNSISPIDGGAFDRLRNETARAFALLRDLYKNGGEPSGEELAAARSATSIALTSLSEYRLPAGTTAAVQDIVGQTARQAAEALEAIKRLPDDPKSVGQDLESVASIIERAVGPAIAEDTPADEDATLQAAEDGPRTISQAPLTQSSNSVIIRRGDTLWQISRRLYGQGVRYTTIYLANQDQIIDPDLIEPGQIFGVPGEARPDSEELHRKRLQKLIR